MEIKFSDAAAPVEFRKTADGYLVGTVKCARTGIQVYTRKELGLQGDGVVNVYRPPEVVFSKDSLATFAGKPVTLGHPSVPVTADNWKDLAVGAIGEDIARDGETVRVPIALMDAAAIGLVEQGLREISMGYSTPVTMEDGVTPDGIPYQAKQTGPIRINHLAIVSQARGGADLKIPLGDSKWGASPVIQQKDEKPMHRIVIDGLTIEVGDQAREAIVKLQGQLADATKQLSEAEATIAAKDTELAQKDAELGAKDEAIEQAKKAIPSGPALDALVAERAAILDAARAVAPDLKTDGMSNVEIKKAVVRKSLGDSVVDGKLAGKSEAYVDSYYDANFDILTADRKATQEMADGLAGARPTLGDAARLEDEAYSATLKRFNRKK